MRIRAGLLGLGNECDFGDPCFGKSIHHDDDGLDGEAIVGFNDYGEVGLVISQYGEFGGQGLQTGGITVDGEFTILGERDHVNAVWRQGFAIGGGGGDDEIGFVAEKRSGDHKDDQKHKCQIEKWCDVELTECAVVAISMTHDN